MPREFMAEVEVFSIRGNNSGKSISKYQYAQVHMPTITDRK